jgi:predicted RNase H-like HicB family nuclease
MRKSRNLETGKTRRVTLALSGDAKGFSAYCLEVPGVYATGKTESAVRERMKSGIAFHAEQLAKSGESLDFEGPLKTIYIDVPLSVFNKKPRQPTRGARKAS